MNKKKKTQLLCFAKYIVYLEIFNVFNMVYALFYTSINRPLKIFYNKKSSWHNRSNELDYAFNVERGLTSFRFEALHLSTIIFQPTDKLLLSKTTTPRHNITPRILAV